MSSSRIAITQANGNVVVVSLSRLGLATIFATAMVISWVLGGWVRHQQQQQQLLIPHHEMLNVAVPLWKHETVVIKTSSIFSNRVESEGSVMITAEGNSASTLQQQDSSRVQHSTPWGGHLFVDIRDANVTWFSLKETVMAAMMQVVIQATTSSTISSATNSSQVTYFCHELIATSGVDCAMSLLNGHLHVRTWPTDHAITVDFFSTHRSIHEMVALLPIITNQFGATMGYSTSGTGRNDNEDSEIQPQIVWSYRTRGFTTTATPPSPLYQSTSEVTSSHLSLDGTLRDPDILKYHVASIPTSFQQIDIYDVIEPRFRTYESYQRSLLKDDTTHYYESYHPELFQKDRLVFRNHVLSSRRYGVIAQYETLVHPAMFCHSNPKHVAILGGGDGASLREVLKHTSVQEVLVLESDKEWMQIAHEYLSLWSDCSTLLMGGNVSCFDDPRVTVLHVDPIAWLVNQFGDSTQTDSVIGFDVIIADFWIPSLDYGTTFNPRDAVKAFSSALGTSGVLAMQLGNEKISHNLERTLSSFHVMDEMIRGFDDFGSIIEYEEMYGRLKVPWKFAVAMKDVGSRPKWFANEAEVHLSIRERLGRTVAGSIPLSYFDGASLISFQLPSRIAENRWCQEKPESCRGGHGFDVNVTNIPTSSFQVKKSQAGGGRGVFAKEFISKNTYLGMEECVHSMFLPPSTMDLLFNITEYINVDFLRVLFDGYVDGYGWNLYSHGALACAVDSNIFTFVNHGCNGTYNMGIVMRYHETEIDLNMEPTSLHDIRHPKYDTFAERHYPFITCRQELITLRDILPGEEILSNYLYYSGVNDKDDWIEDIQDLQAMCKGTGHGVVTSYEQGK